ncbi:MULTISPECIES: hydroxyacylglutathione hydrolase [Burkholderia]|uniref:Hydroxyacylglutathione hydrolase n=1 Tax=Burkholderia mayonis TaxID=1385591 RepID=A0A1B4FF26_9BURK|nr:MULTISPECIES: hydroxyacylglutathione hydrolase [Burkholderia]AOJ02288.1 hydroxyacylglutathione hydrolase [Burkholderia mayonis]KVE36159.1 hydroxyacylglutathione hydrolase [Burkholderia sp. BDU5]KVE47033.1 hydroxyacylglutathione hydrolase [Burkholderia mayonis]
MNELEYVPVPAFDDNYIWLVSDGSDAVAVDPGEAAPVRRYLDARGWRLTAILLTHHHGDHVGGVAELLATSRGSDSFAVFGPAHEAIEHVTRRLSGGERVRIGSPALEFDVIDVPGHTRGHIAYFQAAGAGPAGPAHAAPHLFCGDTLFSCGCGRLFEGTPAQMLASLDALAALPGDTRVHCAHEYTLSNIQFALACEPGNAALAAWRDEASARRARNEPTLPTTIAHERAVNPFLRADSPSIRATLETQLHEAAPDRLAAFTLMREWKNRFR